MLFINISSDKVQIADAKQEQFLDRNGIESTLWEALVDRYRQSPFDEILLLNWPGGFTNLRVGTLTLNLLNKLLGHQWDWWFKIYSLTKLEFYSYLSQKWFLPRDGVIYIWQKSNVRLYDTNEKTYEQIKLDALPKNQTLFFDSVQEDYRHENVANMLSFHMIDKWLEVQRENKSLLVNIADLDITPQSQIKPEYMIQAVI